MPIFVTNDSKNLEGFLITETNPKSRSVIINSGLYLDSDTGDVVKYDGSTTFVLNLPLLKQWVILSISFFTGELNITYGSESVNPTIPILASDSFVIGMILLDNIKKVISNDDIYQVNTKNDI